MKAFPKFLIGSSMALLLSSGVAYGENWFYGAIVAESETWNAEMIGEKEFDVSGESPNIPPDYYKTVDYSGKKYVQHNSTNGEKSHTRIRLSGTNTWDHPTGNLQKNALWEEGLRPEEDINYEFGCEEGTLIDDTIAFTDSHYTTSVGDGTTPVSKTLRKGNAECTYILAQDESSWSWGHNGFEIELSDPDSEEDALARVEYNDEVVVGWSSMGFHDIRGVTSGNRDFTRQETEFFARFSGCAQGEYDIEYTIHVLPMDAEVEGDEEFRKIEFPRTSLDEDGRGPTVRLPGHEGFDKRGFEYTVVSARARRIDDGCNGNSLMGTACTRGGSIVWDLSLGKSGNGRFAGTLSIRSDNISSETYTPESLQLVTGHYDDLDVVYESDGETIHQILAAQGLADVVVIDSEEFQIDFYHREDVGSPDSSGVYPLIDNPDPFVTWRVKKGTGSSGDELDLIREKNGQQLVYNVEQEVLDPGIEKEKWTISEANGLRITEVVEEYDSGEDLWIKDTKLLDGSQNVHYHKIEHFKELDWGEERVKLIEDPNGDAWTTEWAYFEDKDNDSGYGQIESEIDPGGKVTEYYYNVDGWRTDKVSTYLDQGISGPNDGRNEVIDYSVVWDQDGDGIDEPIDTITEEILGTEVSRVHEIAWTKEIEEGGEKFRERSRFVCVQTGASWNNASNLETRTRIHADGPFEGKVSRIIHPDDTITTYEYEIVGGDNLKTTMEVGEANGNDEVIDGERMVTTVDEAGNQLLKRVYDIVSGVLTHEEDTVETDEFGRPTLVAYLDGVFETTTYSSCCGAVSSSQSKEVEVTFTYDDLGRIQTEESAGITKIFEYNPMDQVTKITRKGTDDSEIVREESQYDLAGKRISRKDASGETTVFGESIDANGDTVRTTTYPNLKQRVETYYPDGSIKEISGEGAHPRKYEYDFSSGSVWTRMVRPVKDETGTWIDDEWTEQYRDMAGRNYRTEYPDGSFEERQFNDKGQLVERTDADGVTVLYAYNDRGEREISAVDANGNGNIDYAGDDRITQTVSEVLDSSDPNNTRGVDIERTLTYVWDESGTDQKVLSRSVEVSADGLESWTGEFGKVTHTEVEYDTSNEERTETITHPDENYTVREFEQGRSVSVTYYASDDSTLASDTHSYDEHGRVEFQTNSVTGTTDFTYYDDDRVETVKTPDPWSSKSGPGWERQTTTYFYDEMGRQNKIDYYDQTSVEFEYYPTGELERTWGARTYPVEYKYDAQGRMTEMTTWEDYDGQTGAAVTEWEYDSERGWLDEKIYPDGSGPTYTYTDAGRLETRTWERGVVTTYGYDTHTADLISIGYSDSTPSVTYEYNRLGRRDKIIDGSGTRELEYTSWGELSLEKYTSGTLSGRSVEHDYDVNTERLEEINILDGTMVLKSQVYSYDPDTNRLWEVSQNMRGVRYDSYQGYRNVGMTFRKSTGAVEEAHRHMDNLNRPIHTYLGPDWLSSNPPFLEEHDYNNANQRVGVARKGDDEPTWRWEYGYDAMGQVDAADRHWGDIGGSSDPVQGQEYAYEYDDIGNRVLHTVNSETANYTLATGTDEGLNQYEDRDVPGVIDVLGLSIYDYTDIWVEMGIDSYLADHRRDEYFYHQLSVSNGSSDLYEEVTITEKDGSTQVDETSGFRFVAKDPETFSYDSDGNLLSDGRWQYTWDGENRLIRAEEIRTAGTGDLELRRITFTYDDQGRRVKRLLEEDDGSGGWVTGSGRSEILYLFSGWNAIAELDDSLTVERTYLWGLDQGEKNDYRRTSRGASIGRSSGGVGGLLMVSVHSSRGTTRRFVHHDANGNVVALLSVGNGDIMATYDYDSFGNLIRATGSSANLNPFRFSTKYHDEALDLYWYGYRYYSPSMGRFLNRDPIEEQGGLNLYAFVGNDPVNRWDYLGLNAILDPEPQPGDPDWPPPIDLPPGVPPIRPPFDPTDPPWGDSPPPVSHLLDELESACDMINACDECSYERGRFRRRGHLPQRTLDETKRLCENPYSIPIRRQRDNDRFCNENPNRCGYHRGGRITVCNNSFTRLPCADNLACTLAHEIYHLAAHNIIKTASDVRHPDDANIFDGCLGCPVSAPH